MKLVVSEFPCLPFRPTSSVRLQPRKRLVPKIPGFGGSAGVDVELIEGEANLAELGMLDHDVIDPPLDDLDVECVSVRQHHGLGAGNRSDQAQHRGHHKPIKHLLALSFGSRVEREQLGLRNQVAPLAS